MTEAGMGAKMEAKMEAGCDDDWRAMRDGAAAALIVEALRSPCVDAATGYPPATINAAATVAGLLHCLDVAGDPGALRDEVRRLGRALPDVARTGGVMAWRVARRMRDAAADLERALLRASPDAPSAVADAAATVREARKVHLPALIALADPVAKANAAKGFEAIARADARSARATSAGTPLPPAPMEGLAP